MSVSSLPVGKPEPVILWKDLNEEFPVDYCIELNFSEKHGENVLEVVADFVSAVYSKFLEMDKEDRENLATDNVWISKQPCVLSVEERLKFKNELRKKILDNLNVKKEAPDIKGSVCVLRPTSIKLSTDFGPTGTLLSACEEVFPSVYSMQNWFPYKTCTSISLNAERTQLELNMKFDQDSSDG